MIAEVDLRILSTLTSPHTVTELSNSTDYSSSYISERVSHLEEHDLVTTTRQNHAKQIQAFSTPVLEAYRDLMADNPHIDFPSLISPSMLQVCWFLDAPTTVNEMEPKLTLRRRRIYQLLDQLQSRGLITKHDNQYVLTDNLQGLAEFAHAVIKYDHQHCAQTYFPAVTVVWCAPHEALIMTPTDATEDVVEAFEEQTDWHMTGLPRFEEHGLEFFIAGAPPHFYSELDHTLTPADLICHTLKLDADTRNLSYCALLLVATDISYEDLRGAAEYYGIKETVDALITFVETKGGTRRQGIRLPDWSEMTSLASQYGVPV